MNARTDPQLLQPEDAAAPSPQAEAAARPAPAAADPASDHAAAQADMPSGPSDVALAAAVVAWHNRHPLARRLQASEVGGMGTLSLPVLLPPPLTGWRRWLQRGPLRPRVPPAFEEADLIAGLSARQISRFAHRHADTERPGPPEWPQRVLPVRAGAEAAHARHLFSAAFKAGPGASRRVLIGPGPKRPVLGRRVWSRARLALGSALLLSLLAGLGAAAWWWRSHAAAVPAGAAGAAAAAALPASAASAAVAPAAPAASVPSMAPVAASGAGHVAEAASAADLGASAVLPAAGAAASAVAGATAVAAVTAEAAAPAAPEAPAPVAHAGPDAHAAAAPIAAPAVKAHMPSPSGAAPVPPAAPAQRGPTGERPALGAPSGSQTASASGHHALVSAPTWRRGELAAQRARLTRLMGSELGRLQVDVLRLPEGEVLALWPLASQAEAEALARRLGRDGLAMLAVDF